MRKFYLQNIPPGDILINDKTDNSLVRIFKTKSFHRWAEQINLDNICLHTSVKQIENGLFDACLGGHLYKKRIAIRNKGKSGGLRTIIAFKKDDKAFFIYGFAKNHKENITEKETNELKGLAKIYFSYSESQIKTALQNNEIIEVINNG